MTHRRSRPGALPRRGLMALALTIGSLVLLFSFRTPQPSATPIVVSDAAMAPGMTRLVGEPVTTRWGDVQVAVTVDGADIIGAETIRMPDRDGRSRRLSERAGPILRVQTVVSDGQQVDVVSGATFTSRAYAASLQSALDQLGA